MDASVERDSEEAALCRLLEIEPRSVPAHLRLGDRRAREGKDNIARYFYRRALTLSEAQGPAGEALDEVCRAKASLADLERRTYTQRETKLTARGFPPDAWSPRFRQAIENAAERPNPGGPDPTDFYFPGLPPIEFFDPGDFGWAARVEAATPAIRQELERELTSGADQFRPYIQNLSLSPEANAALLGKKDWSVLALCETGWVVREVIERFPRTWEALSQVPFPGVHGWAPTIMFSRLTPGTHVPAHNGMFNSRLICHLPLIVPPGCRFRVGNEVREWEEGKLTIFDDTIEHEAWNDGSKDRVVLIFDVWHPELTEVEKEELTALFHP